MLQLLGPLLKNLWKLTFPMLVSFGKALNTICFKKTGSSNTLLRFVPVFLKQTLSVQLWNFKDGGS